MSSRTTTRTTAVSSRRSQASASVTELSSRRGVAAPALNLGCVVGTLSSTPEIRALASGSALAVLQVTTRPPDGPAVSVPVSLVDPPAWVATLDTGDDVVAIGTIRRRFFRAGGTTASRVELDASALARWSDRRARRRIARSVATTLEAFLTSAE